MNYGPVNFPGRYLPILHLSRAIPQIKNTTVECQTLHEKVDIIYCVGMTNISDHLTCSWTLQPLTYKTHLALRLNGTLVQRDAFTHHPAMWHPSPTSQTSV